MEVSRIIKDLRLRRIILPRDLAAFERILSEASPAKASEVLSLYRLVSKDLTKSIIDNIEKIKLTTKLTFAKLGPSLQSAISSEFEDNPEKRAIYFFGLMHLFFKKKSTIKVTPPQEVRDFFDDQGNLENSLLTLFRVVPRLVYENNDFYKYFAGFLRDNKISPNFEKLSPEIFKIANSFNELVKLVKTIKIIAKDEIEILPIESFLKFLQEKVSMEDVNISDFLELLDSTSYSGEAFDSELVLSFLNQTITGSNHLILSSVTERLLELFDEEALKEVLFYYIQQGGNPECFFKIDKFDSQRAASFLGLIKNETDPARYIKCLINLGRFCKLEDLAHLIEGLEPKQLAFLKGRLDSKRDEVFLNYIIDKSKKSPSVADDENPDFLKVIEDAEELKESVRGQGPDKIKFLTKVVSFLDRRVFVNDLAIIKSFFSNPELTCKEAIVILSNRDIGDSLRSFALTKVNDYAQRHGAATIVFMIDIVNLRDDKISCVLDNLRGDFKITVADLFNELWNSPRMSGARNSTSGVKFILAGYSDESLVSINIDPPIIIDDGIANGIANGIQLNTVNQVVALMSFYPDLINDPTIVSLAKNDALIAAINRSFGFYDASFVSGAQKALLDQINSVISPDEQKIETNSLIPFSTIAFDVISFPKKRGSLSAIVRNSSIFRALKALNRDSKFEDFFNMLSPEDRQALNFEKPQDEIIGEVRRWVDIAKKDLQEELSQIALDLSKMPPDHKQNSPYLIKRRRKQELQSIAEMSNDILSPDFDKLVKLFGADKVPPHVAEFIKNKAAMENYQSMTKNSDNGNNGTPWRKFLENRDTNLQMAELALDPKEILDSISSQFALTRQPECYANLRANLKREIDSRSAVSPNHAAVSTALFQFSLRIAGNDAHTIADGDYMATLEQRYPGSHLPVRSFFYSVGQELCRHGKLQKLSVAQNKLLEDVQVLQSAIAESGDLEDDHDPFLEKYSQEFKAFQKKVGAFNLTKDEVLPKFSEYLQERLIEITIALGSETSSLVMSDKFTKNFVTPNSSVASLSQRRLLQTQIQL